MPIGSDVTISSPSLHRRNETLTLLMNAIEKRAAAVREFKRQHDIAEKALERANSAILDRLNGVVALPGSNESPS